MPAEGGSRTLATVAARQARLIAISPEIAAAGWPWTYSATAIPLPVKVPRMLMMFIQALAEG